MYTICTEVTTTKSKSQIMNKRARSRRGVRIAHVLLKTNALCIENTLEKYCLIIVEERSKLNLRV